MTHITRAIPEPMRERKLALKDPMLKQSPEQAAAELGERAGNSLPALRAEVERLTKIIVALSQDSRKP